MYVRADLVLRWLSLEEHGEDELIVGLCLPLLDQVCPVRAPVSKQEGCE